MTRTQIQFPDPLYRRLKHVAEMNDWPLAEVVRRATELYVQRFPEYEHGSTDWSFPVLDMGGDFLVDPATMTTEADVVADAADSRKSR